MSMGFDEIQKLMEANGEEEEKEGVERGIWDVQHGWPRPHNPRHLEEDAWQAWWLPPLEDCKAMIQI